MRRIGFTYILFLVTCAIHAQQPEIELLKARFFMNNHKYSSALSILSALPKEKKTAKEFLWTGECYYQNKEYLNALKQYFKTDSINNDIANFEISKCYARIGDSKNAILWLQKNLKSKFKRNEFEIITDSAFLQVSETPEWKELWKHDWYTNIEVEGNAITALIERGKTDEALNNLERLSSSFVPKYEYYYLQACAYNRMNLTEPALSAINQALNLNTKNEKWYSLRANLLLKNKKYQEATDDLTKAIRLNSYNLSLYLQRAQSAILAHNYDIAAKDLRLYQSIDSLNPEIYHQLGLLENAKGNYQNALLYYDQLLAKDQSKPENFIEGGTLALSLKEYQKADEDFGMALDLDPTLKDAYLKKGNAQFYLNNMEDACYNWVKAQQYGSSEATKLLYDNCKAYK